MLDCCIYINNHTGNLAAQKQNLMTQELNVNISEKVRQFVKDQEGRWKRFISDKMLEHLLIQLITDDYGNHSRQKIENIAYNIGCTIFEQVLEHKCEAGGNGHDVAQDLAKYFKQ